MKISPKAFEKFFKLVAEREEALCKEMEQLEQRFREGAISSQEFSSQMEELEGSFFRPM